MKKYIILFHCLLFISFIQYTCYSEFKVIAKKGSIQTKSVNSDWSEIKISNLIKDSDELKISANSYVLLYYTNGRSIELSKPGVYRLSDFVRKSKEKNGINFRFIEYIIKELNDKKRIMNDENNTKKGYIPGGIERSIILDCKQLPKATSKDDRKYIFLNYPKTGHVLSGDIDFSWTSLPGAEVYEFILTDSDEKVVFNKVVEGTNLKINTKKLNLISDKCYNWEIKSCNQISESNCISLLSDKSLKTYADTVKKIKSEYSTMSPAAQNLFIAAFYADKNICSEARKYFRLAVENDPENMDFRTIYSNYLASQGYSSEAEEVLK